MAMRICECGFANVEAAESCTACGASLGRTEPQAVGSQLTLSKANGEGCADVTIPAPGGIIGRAGDFSPEVFSERVSGIHANITATDTCWEIEHLGRNKSAILRAGEWIDLPHDMKVGLLDGDQLRLADMLFRVSIASAAEDPEEEDLDSSTDCAAASDIAGEQTERWAITCPVCGKVYEVSDVDARIASCDTCIDVLDKRKIATVSAKREPMADSPSE